jgi:preprotein translocase SecF subunit
MYNIVQYRKWYYLISAIIIIPGLIAMILGVVTTGRPLKLSIDFTGGVYWEFTLNQAVPPADVRAVFTDFGLNDTAVTTLGGEENHFQARLKNIEQETKEAIQTELSNRFGAVETLQFRNVGPSIGREVTRAAFIAVAFAAIAILAFIVFAFRNVPHPLRYGVCAITAMIHDILVTVGFAAIMGFLAGWEIDALFLTALLTVIGFSVQDTIVVFDRIRENNVRHRSESFETIANRSLLETIGRSLTTQLSAIFIMVAILLFGGATIRQFIAVMLIGLISGTYSSIFNAVPLLVTWEGWASKRARQRSSTATV